MNKKGFTLIELLVVIAVIGILSSIVLVSLNSARSKGNDAKMKGQLSGIRAQAEIYYDSNGNYGTDSEGTKDKGVCADPKVLKQRSLNSNSSTVDATCFAKTSGWVAFYPLKSVSGNFCVDSDGFSGIITTTPSATSNCSGASY